MNKTTLITPVSKMRCEEAQQSRILHITEVLATRGRRFASRIWPENVLWDYFGYFCPLVIHDDDSGLTRIKRGGSQ